MNLWRAISRWLAWRRTRRQIRDLQVILVLVLICVLCNVVTFGCGLVGYVMQQIGLLPEQTPAPYGSTGESAGLPPWCVRPADVPTTLFRLEG